VPNKDRGTRDRILRAASALFYKRGINTTGVKELHEEANVSIRTLYNHFPSKDDVVLAYLERTTEDSPLDRTDLPHRERLLSIFTTPSHIDGPYRGCPMINASAELADPDHPAHRFSTERKVRFAERLADIAREAGATDPDTLGQRLALLYDGFSARSMVLNSGKPRQVALELATQLVDTALTR
jgi:AcrR family transcriptional regulator